MPRGWVADPYRRRDSHWVQHWLSRHQRGSARCLEAEHPWGPVRLAVSLVLAVAQPVGRDIARVTDGQAVNVGSISELVDDFERGGFLALQPFGINRVHQGNWVLGVELANQF